MPNFYRVLKADPLDGEFTPNKPGAKPLKSFWCQVEGADSPVMITKQVPNTPSLTHGHYGVLEPRRSAKGTQYYKFTSMQRPEGVSVPSYDATEAQAQPTAQAAQPASDQTEIPNWFHPFAIMIRELWDDMKERKAEETIVAAPHSEETATENYDKPIDKAKLDAIFGEELPDPVEVPEGN